MATLTNGKTLEIGGMSGPRFEEIYIRGFEIDRGDTVMSATHVALWNGAEWRLLRTFDIELVDLHYAADAGLYCMGSRGELFLFRDDGWTTVNPGISPRIRVSTLRVAKSGMYALGPQNLLFRLAGNEWARIATPEANTTLLGLADTPAGETIVCGTHGYVAIGTQNTFARTEFPTNVDFHDVIANRDMVYLCGQRAMLLARRGDEWTELDAEGRDLDFLNLRVYQSRVLIAADDDILEARQLEIVPFAEVDSQRLTVIGELLFSDGMEAIMMLRDGEWTEFPVSFTIPDIGSATARPRR